MFDGVLERFDHVNDSFHEDCMMLTESNDPAQSCGCAPPGVAQAAAWVS